VLIITPATDFLRCIHAVLLVCHWKTRSRWVETRQQISYIEYCAKWLPLKAEPTSTKGQFCFLCCRIKFKESQQPPGFVPSDRLEEDWLSGLRLKLASFDARFLLKIGLIYLHLVDFTPYFAQDHDHNCHCVRLNAKYHMIRHNQWKSFPFVINRI